MAKKEEKVQLNRQELMDAIEKYDRAAVCEAIEAKSLDIIGADEREEVVAKIVALRDMDCLAALMKEIEFTPAMFALDLENRNNRDFVCNALDKVAKKANVTDGNNANEFFDLAVEVGNIKIVEKIIKKSVTSEQYLKLASGSNATFQLLVDMKVSNIAEADQAAILAAAAMTSNGKERVSDLTEAGYKVSAKNSNGKCAADLVEEAIANTSYAKNKKGELEKKSNQAALSYLKHFDESVAEVSADKKLKIGTLLAAVVMIVLCISILTTMWYNRELLFGSKTTEQTATTEDGGATVDENADVEATYNTDTSLVVKDGDKINLDYVGFIDDVAFDGGNTQGMGTDLTIGSHLYIDDFEEQIIGHNVGDSFDVTVTFPDDYTSADLAGKEAVFKCVINGIYTE